MTFTGNNRTHMIRIPEGGRFEFRLPDGAANPYLMPAAILAAGLDGIARKADPRQGARHQHVHRGPQGAGGDEEAAAQSPRRDPSHRRLKVLRRELGAEFVDAYVKLKTAEWNDFTRHLTDWERKNTLDC